LSLVNDCLVLRQLTDGGPQVRAAFDPKRLSATVRMKMDGNQPRVVIEGYNGAEVLTTYTWDDSNPPVLWRNRGVSTFILMDDPDDAERVARAFSHLINMMGGKNGSL
jgi:hypothetical protein